MTQDATAAQPVSEAPTASEDASPAAAELAEQTAPADGAANAEQTPNQDALPDRYELPVGLAHFEIPEAAVRGLEQLAREEGLTQAELDDLANEAMGDPEARLAELQDAFGDRAGETLRATAIFADKLRADHGDAVLQLETTVAGVKLLNAMRLAAEGVGMGDALPAAKTAEATAEEASEEAPPPAKKTEADLKSMMQDPRYWRDRDPAFVNEVAREFKRAYPGQVQTAAIAPGGGR